MSRSMAASSSRRPDPVCAMAATRTPSGAMPRPIIFPPKAFGIGAVLLPLLVCAIAQVLPPWASQRSPLRSQLIAVTPDVVMELDGLAPPDAHTSMVFPSAVTPAAYWPPGDTATRDRAGTLVRLSRRHGRGTRLAPSARRYWLSLAAPSGRRPGQPSRWSPRSPETPRRIATRPARCRRSRSWSMPRPDTGCSSCTCSASARDPGSGRRRRAGRSGGYPRVAVDLKLDRLDAAGFPAARSGSRPAARRSARE